MWSSPGRVCHGPDLYLLSALILDWCSPGDVSRRLYGPGDVTDEYAKLGLGKDDSGHFPLFIQPMECLPGVYPSPFNTESSQICM